jgi:hypothetical protein
LHSGVRERRAESKLCRRTKRSGAHSAHGSVFDPEHGAGRRRQRRRRAGAQVADTWKSVVHPSRPAPLPDKGYNTLQVFSSVVTAKCNEGAQKHTEPLIVSPLVLQVYHQII